MNGSFRKKPNGSVELRVWLDMPDGSHVQKSFCRRTRALAKAAYEEFLERGKEAQAHRQTVAGIAPPCLGPFSAPMAAAIAE